MAKIKFNYRFSGFSEDEILEEGKRLADEINLMKKVAESNNYDDDRASINLPFDEGSLKCISAIAGKFKAIEYLAVIGIGGSNLGAMAVFEAMKGKLHNQLTGRTKVLFAGTVDSDMINDISNLMERALKSGKEVVINVVTKSGTTTETIANFHVLLDVLKKYRRNYKDYVVATTDKGSKLYELAKREKFELLEIPKKVGGRYSVFSSAGLFPLKVVGIGIDNLLRGAAKMRDNCLDKDILKNPAAISAILLYLHNKNGKNINDNFLFANDLESIGKWYRQLMGESIGKQHGIEGNTVNKGVTPTVSIGSTDLHSMAQLYLGGPYDKYTTFVTLEKFNNKIRIPKIRELKDLVANIQGKRLDEIMDAILKGVQIAFQKGKRQYSEILLPDKSEDSVGQLLQLKMMEIIYLGCLLGVNPFDQPNVEDYKKETRRILEK